MATVLTYGTFDMFHIGHLRLLQRARGLGSRLVVAVSTDRFNLVKGKRSVIPFEDRCTLLLGLRCVDAVIPEDSWEQKITDVVERDVDIFVMGNDWEGKFDELEAYCQVVYLPRTEGISTTEIKDVLRAPKSLAPPRVSRLQPPLL